MSENLTRDEYNEIKVQFHNETTDEVVKLSSHLDYDDYIEMSCEEFDTFMNSEFQKWLAFNVNCGWFLLDSEDEKNGQ